MSGGMGDAAGVVADRGLRLGISIIGGGIWKLGFASLDEPYDDIADDECDRARGERTGAWR